MTFPPDLSALPEVLYKYRTFDEFGWRALEERELFFASPKRFNDPADTRNPILYEQGTEQEIYRMNMEKARIAFPHWTRANRRKWSRMQARTVYKNRDDPERKESLRRSIDETMDRDAGILSLSAVRDQTLMWSHYADGHRGFCLGIRSRAFLTFAGQQSWKGIHFLTAPVEYHDTPPPLIPYQMSDTEMFMTKIFGKSSDWSYEREYRVLCSERADFALSLPPSVLHSITLGTRCSSEDRERVLRLAQSSDSPVPVEVADLNDSGTFDFRPVASR